MIGLLRRQSPHRDTAERLYAAITEQSRQASFFADLQIPDTVDGRFDVLALHAWMVIDRVRQEADGEAVAQAVFDAMFAHLDFAVREMGAQDLGVGRRIKVMAEGLHGRALAFRTAIADPDPVALQNALRRNVFGKADPIDDAVVRLAAYVRSSVGALAALDQDRLGNAALSWPPV